MKCMRVKYKDGNGKDQERKCFFHLDELDRTKLDARYTSGDQTLEDYVKEITTAGNKNAMIILLEDVILSAYGVKTSDGQGFRKGRDVREEFEYSFAYKQLFKDLAETPEKFEEFLKAVMAPISDKAE